MTLQRPMFPPRADEIDHLQADHASINGSGPAPFSAGGLLYLPTDISPEDLFVSLGELRAEAEAAIERLMILIDDLDGECDREPSGDETEPELGSVAEAAEIDQATWAAGADAEPSLAAPENHPEPCTYWSSRRAVRKHPHGSQNHWAQGGSDEREGDDGCDDREGDELQHGGEAEREDYEYGGDDELSESSMDGPSSDGI